MRIVLEASQDHGIETPRTFRLNVDRIEVVEVLDHLTMLFASARAAGTAEVSLTLRQTELLHGRGREHKRDGH